MNDYDEYDHLLVLSLIDQSFERGSKRLKSLTRWINRYIWTLTTISVISGLMKWWVAWGITIALEFLAIPALIYGHRRIEHEGDAWLEERLPSWCKGLTQRVRMEVKRGTKRS